MASTTLVELYTEIMAQAGYPSLLNNPWRDAAASPYISQRMLDALNRADRYLHSWFSNTMPQMVLRNKTVTMSAGVETAWTAVGITSLVLNAYGQEVQIKGLRDLPALRRIALEQNWGYCGTVAPYAIVFTKPGYVEIQPPNMPAASTLKVYYVATGGGFLSNGTVEVATLTDEYAQPNYLDMLIFRTIHNLYVMIHRDTSEVDMELEQLKIEVMRGSGFGDIQSDLEVEVPSLL